MSDEIKPARRQLSQITVGGITYRIGPLECPSCHARMHGVEGYGVLRPHCQGKNCRKAWHAVRIPPSATGDLIFAMYGEVVARALISGNSEQISMPRTDNELKRLRIVSSSPLYIQHDFDYNEPDRGLGWDKVKGLLEKLLRVA